MCKKTIREQDEVIIKLKAQVQEKLAASEISKSALPVAVPNAAANQDIGQSIPISQSATTMPPDGLFTSNKTRSDVTSVPKGPASSKNIENSKSSSSLKSAANTDYTEQRDNSISDNPQILPRGLSQFTLNLDDKYGWAVSMRELQEENASLKERLLELEERLISYSFDKTPTA
jgi:hypothetical protein